MPRRPLLAALLAACAAPAWAVYTPVNPNGNGDGDERCLAGVTCAAGAYSGAKSIIRSLEIDFGLAAGTIQRVDDALDTSWVKLAADAALRPVARYADDNGLLGVGVTSGAGYTVLTASLTDNRVWLEHPSALAGTPQAGDFRQNNFSWIGVPGAVDSLFAFVLQNVTSSLLLASDASLPGYANSGSAADWMVTYHVPGLDYYVLAWEDRTNVKHGRPNDYDYDDYVFLLRGAAPKLLAQDLPMPTPLPAPLAGFALGLCVLARALRRRGAG
jgi:hypothetical protein